MNPHTRQVNARLKPLLTREFLEREYAQKGRCCREIAEDFGVERATILKYLREHGIARRAAGGGRRYKEADFSGFAGPETSWHAYWLGFLAADGCIFNGSRRFLQVRLAVKDKAHLEALRLGLKTDQAINVSHNGGHPSAQIAFSSDAALSTFAVWGIVPNKAQVLSFPQSMPVDKMAPFIRGYFDGDGTIYLRHRGRCVEAVCRFICASTEFLNHLASVLQAQGIGCSAMYRSSSNACVLPLRGGTSNLDAFYRYLYCDGGVCLERKKVVFEEFFRARDFHGN